MPGEAGAEPERAKRHGPLQVLMSDEHLAAAAASGSWRELSSATAQMPWAQQNSGQSLDSQISQDSAWRKAAIEKADMFKV